MNRGNHGGEIDHRVLRNISFTAHRMGRQLAVPGMDRDDYQQDLLLDLLRRSAAFDPDRATFATFADRIVRHRVFRLNAPTAALSAARQTISLSTPISEDAQQTLEDVLADPSAETEEAIAVRLDVGAFIDALPQHLRQVCEVVGNEESLKSAALHAGVHRATLYGRLSVLRAKAIERGLEIYVEQWADTPKGTPVCGQHINTVTPMSEQRPSTIRLLITANEFAARLSNASVGDVVEYHRGVLVIDRLVSARRLSSDDCAELNRVADAALTAAVGGRCRLVQRRHGRDDHSYLAVKSSTEGQRS